MKLPPEFEDDEFAGMRGLVLAIIFSLGFYLIIATSIYLYAR